MACAGGLDLKPFRTVSPAKVLCLLAEDDQSEIERRLWAISEGAFPENLHVASVAGQIGSLMELQNGNPVRSKWYHWLESTIKAHKGLDVLILDPLSRLFGLSENLNEHATAFITALENLSHKYKLTILIVHHTNKASRTDEKQSSSMVRGASAFVDAARWVIGLRQMPDTDKKRYGLTDGNYIELSLVKSNYSKTLNHSIFYKISDCGVLEYFTPGKNRQDNIARTLADTLSEYASENQFFTRRELLKEKTGKPIADAIKENIEAFKRGELNNAIDRAFELGLLSERTEHTGKTIKKLLIPVSTEITPEFFMPENTGKKSDSGVESNKNSSITPESDNNGILKKSDVKYNKNSNITPEKILS